jgi:AcrR family transcriptional regulator
MPLSDLLDERRPHRADAARNFDAILAAARAEFTEHGTDAALDDIARRAGVGPATLYRNFATRGDLVEAVYVAEVDALCQDTFRLAAEEDPWPALVAWVRHFITYIAIKRVLASRRTRPRIRHVPRLPRRAIRVRQTATDPRPRIRIRQRQPHHP